MFETLNFPFVVDAVKIAIDFAIPITCEVMEIATGHDRFLPKGGDRHGIWQQIEGMA